MATRKLAGNWIATGTTVVATPGPSGAARVLPEQRDAAERIVGRIRGGRERALQREQRLADVVARGEGITCGKPDQQQNPEHVALGP